MGPRELARWQWDGYPRYHGDRTNLLIHIALVPLFLAGNIAVVGGLTLRSWILAAGGLTVMILSFAAQGYGHGREQTSAIPFAGPANAIGRIFLEQWITFPRFVLSGGWLQAFRAGPSR
jgi:hypothetical protein